MTGNGRPDVHPTKPVEYFGRKASAFTKRMVEGQEVYLEYEQGSPTKDRYGRTLGYIYPQDGTLLNKEIIEVLCSRLPLAA